MIYEATKIEILRNLNILIPVTGIFAMARPPETNMLERDIFVAQGGILLNLPSFDSIPRN